MKQKETMNKEINNSIILTGMPGSGKSTIAKELSIKTGLDLIDLDLLIEKNENEKITEIFKNFGEQYFRNLETNYIKSLINKNNFILSTGGGTVIKEENIVLLKSIGKVFYLDVTPDIIYERIKGDKSRPLLNCENPAEKLNFLYNSRINSYKKADYIINANKSTDKITDEIIKIYEKNKC